MPKKCECPQCYFEFECDDDVVAGEVITCPDCSADLEVTAVSGDKVEVEPAETSEEDWGE
ncbi:MAG: lysine biosynthesis protein LysW [Promethearchaeota archaeon]